MSLLQCLDFLCTVLPQIYLAASAWLWPCRPTCHNGKGTLGFHSKVDLRPVWTPEPLRRNLGTAAIGIEDRRWRVQGHHPFSQAGPHVECIKEPDQAEYAQANGDVDEDFANINFLFLLFTVKCRGLLIFPWRGSSFTSHHPLPLPSHPALLKLEKRRRGERCFYLIV